MFIKVFLIEDRDIVWQDVKNLLESDSGIRVLGHATSGKEAILKIRSNHPNVVILNVSVSAETALEYSRMIRKDFPSINILILSQHDQESQLAAMLDAGADACILKSSIKEELLFAIKKIALDGLYIGPEFTLNMLAKYRNAGRLGKSDTKKELNLTQREMDVLSLIAEGFTNTEIAQRLFTSVRTIETRRKNLLEKTKTSNTATLIRFAVLNGLIK